MADAGTCCYCHKRKGKRTCPALGVICAPCCGQHRLQDIACPADCVYLGGLALVRDPGEAPGIHTKQDWASMWEKLHAYAASRRDLVEPALLQVFDPGSRAEEWEIDLATAHAYFGRRDATGKLLLDHFLAARGRGLGRGEIAAVTALRHAWFSMFAIVAVRRNVGFTARDLLTDETFEVTEVAATQTLRAGGCILAWMMKVGDHVELAGALCEVPDGSRADARAAIEKPGVSPSALSWAALRAIRTAPKRMPTLQTTDGEGLMFCKAHFAVRDEDAVFERLHDHADLAREGDVFTWLARHTVLGTIRLADGELVLETMSRERLTRGKELLSETLGDLVTHRIDSLTDVEAAMRDAPPSREGPEVAPEAVAAYLRDYYRRWLDESIPALGGKTPRKAVKTKQGRAQVEALLADLEPQAEQIDLAGLRRELGLDGGHL